jgi:hypothetical protein
MEGGAEFVGGIRNGFAKSFRDAGESDAGFGIDAAAATAASRCVREKVRPEWERRHET